MKVLYVTYGLPYPPDSGARLRDYNFLVHLAAHHSVTLVCLCRPEEPRQGVAVLEQLGIRTYLFFAHRRSPDQFLRHLIARYPLATYDYIQGDMWRSIRTVARQVEPDIVQIEHSFLAPYLDALPNDFEGHTILDLHNLGALQYASIAHLMRTATYPAPERAASWLKSRLMQSWEASAAGHFDHVLTVSAVDAQILAAENSNVPISVIEGSVDSKTLRPLADSKQPRLIFVGTMGYLPNADAAAWFAESIFPQIRQAVPDAAFDIVGRAPTPRVQALSTLPNVSVTWQVPEVIPYYRAAQVAVIPLRAGGGVRLKILEAMALGRPVVSTTVGCEGLQVCDEEHLLIADQPAAFADAVIRLLRDPDQRARLAQRARAHVERVFDGDRIADKLLTLYASFGSVPDAV